MLDYSLTKTYLSSVLALAGMLITCWRGDIPPSSRSRDGDGAGDHVYSDPRRQRRTASASWQAREGEIKTNGRGIN